MKPNESNPHIGSNGLRIKRESNHHVRIPENRAPNSGRVSVFAAERIINRRRVNWTHEARTSRKKETMKYRRSVASMRN